MSSGATDNPLYHLWKRNFSFAYWDNRIEKLSPYNSADRLDSLYVLLQLSDLYAHWFTVQVRNPDQPWFMVTEKTYMHQIRDTLEKLQVDDPEHGSTIFVSRLLDEPDGLISFERTNEDIEATERDAIARTLLGARAPYNEETGELEYDVDRDVYIGGVNATLNFWNDNKALLNDLKHGFRIIPIDTETIDYLNEQGFFKNQQDFVDDLRKTILEKEENGWGISIARLEVAEDGDHFDVFAHIHYVDSTTCLKMAKLVHRLLFNLFHPRNAISVKEEINDLLVRIEEGTNALEVIEHLETFEVFYNPTASGEEKS